MDKFNNPKIRALIFALIMLIFVSLSDSAAAQTLIYSDHEPLGNMRTTFLHNIFFQRIEKESNGRLHIDEHWNSELSTGYDALKQIKIGNIDLAVIVPEYDSVNLPLHQLFKSFPIGLSGNKQSKFLRSIYQDIPELKNELETQNLIPIYAAMGYPVAFFSTYSMKSLTDVSNKRWRSASFWHRDQLKNAGAIPVTTPWGDEVITALKTNQLDGLMVNIDSGYDINAHEIAPYILTSKNFWLGHIYIIAMNKDVWETLSKDDQLSIQRAADYSYGKMGKFADKAFDRQIELLLDGGAEIRFLTDEELRQWNQAARYTEIQNQWIENNSANKFLLSKIRDAIRLKLKSSLGNDLIR